MNSKFRGSLLGVLIGDCCGATFEGEVMEAGNKLVLKRFLSKLEGDYFSAPSIKFTDDTAMTKSVARCLTNLNDNYSKDLAVNFVKEYFKQPNRGYGNGVIEVFNKLRNSKFSDVQLPANQQFNGQGSFGNGAAMRITPVALYCLNKSDEFLIDLVTKSSTITHSNKIGVNGAILQALAIRQNLKMDSNKNVDVNKYIDELLDKMSTVELGQDEFGITEEKHFTKQLNAMKKLLNKQFDPSVEEIVNILGHSVNALYSVPTAIYSFLRNSSSNDGNPFRKTLEFTINLGGDTDTISSMACSLAGALLGDAVISENLTKHMEDSEEMIKLANQLYIAATKET